MSHTFVIAECGSSHDNDLQKAYRLVEAAKECGADACKFQFWSNSKALADRRKLGKDAEAVYAKYKLPQGWLPILANLCEKKGLEFMCTAFLLEDIPIVAPYVSRFKISAFESGWKEFVDAHVPYGRQVIISVRPEDFYKVEMPERVESVRLHCISKYPCPVEEIGLRHVNRETGLSDHTANVQTGAAAAARNAPAVEAHIKLHDTASTNPDYGHSLQADGEMDDLGVVPFRRYVMNIRAVERML